MAILKPLRLLRAPHARVVEFGDGRAMLEIDGLVCAVCANRVAAALRRVDGVDAAACDLQNGAASVRLTAEVDPDTLTSAVAGSVIAMPLRRAIERLVNAWR